jgi:hypothetical protein
MSAQDHLCPQRYTLPARRAGFKTVDEEAGYIRREWTCAGRAPSQSRSPGSPLPPGRC